MKLTISWLKNYLETDASNDAIIEKLTDLGLEVDDVEDMAAMYAPFKVAKVREAVQHPNADRLRVCQVETVDGMIQVVCGAPNARAGMTAIFAPVGAYIPGLDVTLEKGKIRGEESCGMLVSEREMKLSDEHNGIMDLDDNYAIGTPLTDLYPAFNDVMIDVGLTPDRADCAGIIGVARDLAAAGVGVFKMPDRPEFSNAFPSPVQVETDTPDTCPHFTGRMIKDVKNGESPDWLKQKLESIGLRPISALVDITNYFCIGLNRPLHVYDVNRLQGNIRVQLAKGGEEFDALNDKSYALTGGETVITDDSGVLGLGGIVGGTSTGCELDTTDVFLESAYFEPVSTAVTGRKHQIISDARYRFERGIDPEFTAYGLDLAAQMIVDLCGGEVSDMVEAGAPIDTKRVYDLDIARTEKLTGVSVAEETQIKILRDLGCDVDGANSPYQVTPPSWRPDILGEADLVEEVIRVVGYDKIEALPLRRETVLTDNALSNTHALRVASGRVMADRGLQECVTWSFMPYDLACDFTVGGIVKPSLRLTNPISVEMDTMRPSILPNLIAAVGRNFDRGYPNASLFETGPVFFGVNPDDQMTCAAGVRQGQMADKHWASPDVSRSVDAYDAKADALAVIQSVNPSLKPQMSTGDAPSYFHPGRSGTYRLGKNILASFGEIHPAILDKLGVNGPVVGFEVYLDSIPTAKKSSASRAPLILNPLHPVHRDFAFLVDDGVAADQIISATQKGGGKLVETVHIFDVYQGKGVPEGKKSIALSVQFQPVDKTLTDKEIEEMSQSIIKQVEAKTGATLRG